MLRSGVERRVSGGKEEKRSRLLNAYTGTAAHLGCEEGRGFSVDGISTKMFLFIFAAGFRSSAC